MRDLSLLGINESQRNTGLLYKLFVALTRSNARHRKSVGMGERL